MGRRKSIDKERSASMGKLEDIWGKKRGKKRRRGRMRERDLKKMIEQ